METVYYNNSHAYVFPGTMSDKLVISIEGSGWDSVLGTKNETEWLAVHQGARLLHALKGKYTFFIPEKFKRQPGLDYSGDMEDRANYTAENLLSCYLESINGYLADHSFSSVILIGTSEGAILLPLIYEKMDKSELVTAMVSISYGGLSLYENYLIFSSYLVDIPEDHKEMYFNFVFHFNPINGIYREKDTFEEDVYYTTHRGFNSFKGIRPFEYYKNINIPVLFFHGTYDSLVPVHSTTYIQENLPEKPFTYKYFEWGHQPEKHSDIVAFRNEVAEWIDSVFANFP
jgi:pimeloyl-ACP methyl ester carboxylesterase